MTLFTKIVDRTFAAVGAIVFLQAPQFIHDYTQVLSGHLSEVIWQVDSIRKMAAKSGRSLQVLIDKYNASQDPDISYQGEFIGMLIKRENEFKEAFTALGQANPISKPFLFVKYVNWDLFKETISLFKPGLPLTIEGLIWGVLGLFVGYLLFRALAALVRIFRGR